MTSYRLIPLDDSVVFPGMPATLSFEGKEKRVLLIPRRGDEFAKVGVVAEVTERVKLAGRGYAVSLMGLHRALPGARRHPCRHSPPVGFAKRLVRLRRFRRSAAAIVRWRLEP